MSARLAARVVRHPIVGLSGATPAAMQHVAQTPPESFLDRRSFGLAHWLWIAIAMTAVLAAGPRGARRAIESNTNKAEDWLPESYAESADLRWFRDHFVTEAFALVSWDGCTLGDDEKLRLLARKLEAVRDPQRGFAWYSHVVTGPGMIEQLTRPPTGLDRVAAIARLEGALVGPAPGAAAAGAPTESGQDAARTTCLLAYLAPELMQNNRSMRAAVERIEQIATKECGVPLAEVRMGGPPVDNVTIDKEGERTLIRLAGLSGVVGWALCYLCLRSVRLTAMVFFVAGASAMVSLALVFYYGVFEVLVLGLPQPRFGTTDAIMMSMPAVVYVLGLSGAIHLVNYYRDARLEGGRHGAVERAVRASWSPCFLAAFTTAVGLGSLGASDILPISKFGVFTALGVMAAVAMLFGMLPVMLHTWPLPDRTLQRTRSDYDDRGHAHWYDRLSALTTGRPNFTTAMCLAGMALLALGLPWIQTRVQLLKLLDAQCDLITDYEWLERHLGNLVPMEVVVALDKDQLRSPDEPVGAGDSRRYRMTMFERAALVRRLQQRIESLDPVSRALSAATFAPETIDTGSSASLRRGAEYTVSNALEESRSSLGEYLQTEQGAGGGETGRELWRISARVTALEDIDYGQFVAALRGQVEPVLSAYRARDQIVGVVRDRDRSLRDASVCLVFPADDPAATRPAKGSPEAELAELLRGHTGPKGRVSLLCAARFASADAAARDKLRAALSRQDAVVAFSPEAAETIEGVDVTVVGSVGADDAEGAGAAAGADLAPRAAPRAVYTGVVPLVYKTQRELLTSLRQSILWATVLIGGVMVVVLRSPGAGVVSMIPNIFPIVIVFGALGLLGVKVDIGIMMTASVALGVAVDDTLHYVTWFGRGIRRGLDRRTAARNAYEQCATAMMQTTLVGGLGLAVFATSTFTPTQQFGVLMITILGVALVGDLVLLPALLCGPLGRLFAPRAAARPAEAESPPEAGRGAGEDASPEGPVEGPQLAAVGSDAASSADADPHIDRAGGEGPATIGPPHAPFSPPPGRLAGEPTALSPANSALRERLRGFRRDTQREERG